MKVSQEFIKNNIILLFFGFLFSLFSGFGQTFLISLYVPYLQQEFALSDSYFSSIYGLATIASAFTLTWLGRYIDKIVLTKFSVRVLIGLSLSLMFFSISYGIIMLFLSIYLIRLFGQGLMTHTSITSMARFFGKNRGKAISIAALGHPAGEAFFPIILVGSLHHFGWRLSMFFSGIIVLGLIPITLKLLLKNKKFSQLKMYFPSILISEKEKNQAKTLQLIKNPIFWIMAPTVLASASIGTGFLFFQLKLGEINSWSVEFIAAAFSAYAFGNALMTIFGGWLSDSYTGRKLYPLILLPFSIGLVLLIFSDHWIVYIILISGIGITNGFGGSVKSTAIAELFGVKTLGSVRSLFTTVMVFSTALGPLFFGILLDLSYSFEEISMIALLVFLLVTINSLRILKLTIKE